MVPDHPDNLLPGNARAVPNHAVARESACVIRGAVLRGCQFTAGPESAPRTKRKAWRPEDRLGLPLCIPGHGLVMSNFF